MAPSNCQRRGSVRDSLHRLVMADWSRGRSSSYRPFPLVVLVHDLPYLQDGLLLESVSQGSESGKADKHVTSRPPGTPGWCAFEKLPVGVRSRVHLVRHVTPGAAGGAERRCRQESELQDDSIRWPPRHTALTWETFPWRPSAVFHRASAAPWSRCAPARPCRQKQSLSNPRENPPNNCDLRNQPEARLNKNTSAGKPSWALCWSSRQFLRLAWHFDRAGCTEGHTRRRVIPVRGRVDKLSNIHFLVSPGLIFFRGNTHRAGAHRVLHLQTAAVCWLWTGNFDRPPPRSTHAEITWARVRTLHKGRNSSEGVEQRGTLAVDKGPDRFHLSWRLCQPFGVELVFLTLQVFTKNHLELLLTLIKYFWEKFR